MGSFTVQEEYLNGCNVPLHLCNLCVERDGTLRNANRFPVARLQLVGYSGGIEFDKNGPTGDFIHHGGLDPTMQDIMKSLILRIRDPSGDDFFSLFIELHSQTGGIGGTAPETVVARQAGIRIL
nr:hypothetical protein [uncultured bacterium]